MCSKGVCVSSILCQTATSGFIKDAWELKEHWRKKTCLDARSVKVKVHQLTVWILFDARSVKVKKPQLTVWIPSKYMSVKTHSKLCQLFNTLVIGESGGCLDATSAHITAA